MILKINLMQLIKKMFFSLSQDVFRLERNSNIRHFHKEDRASKIPNTDHSNPMQWWQMKLKNKIQQNLAP